MKKKPTHQQMNAMNWRYKKQTLPEDEFAHLNGEVKVIKPASLPHHLQCKCGYRAKTKQDFDVHWLDEH